MTDLASYVKVLDRLKKFEGLSIPSHCDGARLWIGGIPFAKARLSDVFQADFSSKGILSPRLSSQEKELCRTCNMSYLTSDGSLYLVRKQSVLSIEPIEAISRRKRHTQPTSPAWLRTVGDQHVPKKPTDLVSPNAFAILDVLFRLPQNQLRGFSSGLQFAKSFDLYQPKLSTLMSSMRVHSLMELRDAVSNLSIDWWISALRYPAIRRVFTPFFFHAKPYHSVLNQSEEAKLEKFNSFILSDKNDQLAPGPTELAKKKGFLRDQDCTVWGTSVGLQTLKRDLRLVPGIERNSPTWFLASPLHGFRREAILAHLPDHGLQFATQEGLSRVNVFRAIWDLSYGDARLMEVQVEMLKQVLK
ncbi:hypothetical protein WDW37_20220 [Bdellovibrionota bacterium FG-1]